VFGNIEFSEEDRLILSASNLSTVNNPGVDFFAGKSFDWTYIINHGQFSYFAPALYLLLKNLKKQQDYESIPQDYYLKLAGQYYTVAASNAELLVQISRISQILKEAGIEAIFLKGSGFLQNIYDDIGIRKIGDIDILVRKEKAKACRTLLISAGYKEEGHDSGRLHHDKFLLEKDLRRPIEIHWGLLHTIEEQRKAKIDIEELFQDSIKINSLENPVSILSAEDSLAYRCIDLVDRHSSSFQCLLDISAIIYHKDFDWDKLLRKAKDWQVNGLIYEGLDFARRRSGLAVPLEIMRNLGGSKAFFYNLRHSDGEILNHRYTLKCFISDISRTLKNKRLPAGRQGYKKLSGLPSGLFFVLYLCAAILAFLRFTRRGISDLLESVEITRVPYRFLANHYWKLRERLKIG